ncbi:MAG: hypothetical protein N3E48_02610 [Candidatus Bathyarchaeota archaeon]|nr:hypothetical protein [Candidatus Bathyarchaeota archaeon]
MGRKKVKDFYKYNLKKLVKVLLLQKHKIPGVKGSELKRIFGKDYPKLLMVLDDEVKKLGLKVKVFSDDAFKKSLNEISDKDWILLTFEEGEFEEWSNVSGWRVDDLAILAATIVYINSKGGTVSRSEIEKFLAEKFSVWRIRLNLERFTRLGYLSEDENNVLRIGWRTKAEVDEKHLMKLLTSS